MAIFLNSDSKVIVQGMTGGEGMKHTTRMLASGTQIVGGVNPRKAGTVVAFPGDGQGPVFGTLAPVLDADGLPVVHTVGDLTARHQLARPRIRVAGREGKLKIVKPSDAYPGTVTLIWGVCWEDAALEEPCEVLP